MCSGSAPNARAMVGSAVATTVPSRFCMNSAHATISAVSRTSASPSPAQAGDRRCGTSPGRARGSSHQGTSTVLPVVCRASSAACAFAASFSA